MVLYRNNAVKRRNRSPLKFICCTGGLLSILPGCLTSVPPGKVTAPPAASGDIRVLTFNTGSGLTVKDSGETNAGYGAQQAEIADRWYGNGLAWLPVMRDVRDFIARVQPDIVGFQEIFHPRQCGEIPEEFHEGFVCETWRPGDPSVAGFVLGEHYQIACHRGKDDKCLAVRRAVGRISGCDGAQCLNELDGFEVAGCGSGSRLGRAQIELASGGSLNVVHVHATSGIGFGDAACRRRQFTRLFEEYGSLREEADSIIFGDFNTDPGRGALFDSSARAVARGVGSRPDLNFVTGVGLFAQPTFKGFLNIDHVIASGYSGNCWAAGISDGYPAVTKTAYFDHVPVVCDLRSTMPEREE